MGSVAMGLAVAAALLLSSCSAPPPTRQQTSRQSRPRVVHSTRTEPTARITEQRAKPSKSNPLAHPAAMRRSGSYPGEIGHTASETKIALTLDAGASPSPTPGILQTLRDAGVRVTFFLTGKWCEQNPELVKEIAADGNEICNHTYSHPDLRKLSDEGIVEQLTKTEDIVVGLTGKTTKPYFRPPFGGRDRHVLGVAGEQGYASVYWSLDSLDAYKKGITSQEIEKRVLGRVQGGDIVLMHCGSAATAAALPEIISKLKERGFEIVKVSELTAQAPRE